MSEMTATRMRRLGGAATLAVLAGVWAAAAYFLWTSSTVPGDLRLPHLDVNRYFSARALDRAEDFARFERWNWVASQIAVLLAFGYYALRGERYMRESAAGRIGTGMLLGMLGFAIAWLVQIPFTVLDFWWQRRHGLTSGNILEYILGNWLALAGEFLFLCLALLIVMGLAGFLGRRWWILGGPAFVGVAAVFLFVSPYLTSLKRLPDPTLRAQAHAIATKEGVGGVPIRVEKVSDRTKAVNAYAFGLGPSRRVVLWNTFLNGGYTRGELRVVIGHEYGHQAHFHLPKGLAWYALFAIPGAYLIERLTRRKGGMRNPAAVPLSLLVLVVLQLLATPLTNVISRRFEQEADWSALQVTHDPASAERLFRDFTRADYAVPSPPTWDYLLLEDHPTPIQRIAMAKAWAARRAGR
jgi:Zn-dependent protease with chaperone function